MKSGGGGGGNESAVYKRFSYKKHVIDDLSYNWICYT